MSFYRWWSCILTHRWNWRFVTLATPAFVPVLHEVRTDVDHNLCNLPCQWKTDLRWMLNRRKPSFFFGIQTGPLEFWVDSQSKRKNSRTLEEERSNECPALGYSSYGIEIWFFPLQCYHAESQRERDWEWKETNRKGGTEENWRQKVKTEVTLRTGRTWLFPLLPTFVGFRYRSFEPKRLEFVGQKLTLYSGSVLNEAEDNWWNVFLYRT